MPHRIVYPVILLLSATLATAETREEFLAGVAEEAETARGDDLSHLVDAALLAQDPEQVWILVEHELPRSYLISKFRRIEPSKIADQLLLALVARPWPLDRENKGSASFRNAPSSGDFSYYADYIQKRLGHAMTGLISNDELLEAASSFEERKIVAGNFKQELVKAGFLGTNERTILDTPPPVSPETRKDPASSEKPPVNKDGSEVKPTEERQDPVAKWWIAAAAILLLGAAGYFGLRKKSATA